MPENQPSQPDFPVVRRGYDPQAVGSYLQQVNRAMAEKVTAAEARYVGLERDLAEAHSREEAVHLTLVAATKTKEELLVNAQRDADHTLSHSKEQADELLAEAKKEAFRLVADARQAAEESSTMARDAAKAVTEKAEAAADATRDAARREAVEMINSVETDTASLLTAHEAALVDMRSKYEEEEAELTVRIEVLRSTAADLDARLRAIATGGIGQIAPPVSAETPPQPPPATSAPVPSSSSSTEQAEAPQARKARPTVRPQLIQQAAEAAAAELESAGNAAMASAEAEQAAKAEATAMAEDMAKAEAEATTWAQPITEEVVANSAPDEEPADAEPATELTTAAAAEEAPAVAEESEPIRELEPVAAAVASGMTSDGEAAISRKGSYYSRRSAKLPRIGNEAGRSALAAANAIRGASRNGGSRSESAEDRAARTA